MDNLFQLALSSQTICGGIQFLLFITSLGGVIGALQHYHANDRLTFNCFPKPSDFAKQLCYDNYISTTSPLLIPRNVAAITYAVLCFCWICFMLYGAMKLRQIKRGQTEQDHRQHQWREFLKMSFIHVCFRFVFLGVMLVLFCGYQTIDLSSVFKCRIPETSRSNSNKTLNSFNQTGNALQCNDLHYKERSILNIAIIIIAVLIIFLSMVEVIHLYLTRENFQEKLLGNIFDISGWEKHHFCTTLFVQIEISKIF